MKALGFITKIKTINIISVIGLKEYMYLEPNALKLLPENIKFCHFNERLGFLT